MKLNNLIKEKKSYLCVGLDPDPSKIKNGQTIFDFCQNIIEETLPYTVAYKINTAFFESMGWRGWRLMTNIVDYLKTKNVFVIADAKRGDIENTSRYYAKAFFEELNCDAVTVNPYMGYDSLKPFLDYENKTTIILSLTSNEGAGDFQLNEMTNGNFLFEDVIKCSQNWDKKGDVMYVVGATKSEYLDYIRKIAPNDFLLVPGVGAQGGTLKEVSEKLLTDDCGLLVNMSRSIMYSENPGKEAKKIQKEMEDYLLWRSLKENQDTSLEVMNNL
jgi:orotidine-5'-phosphate decarboxylase